MQFHIKSNLFAEELSIGYLFIFVNLHQSYSYYFILQKPKISHQAALISNHKNNMGTKIKKIRMVSTFVYLHMVHQNLKAKLECNASVNFVQSFCVKTKKKSLSICSILYESHILNVYFVESFLVFLKMHFTVCNVTSYKVYFFNN